MRLVYLSTAEEDFKWMHHSYSFWFREGKERAWRRYQNSLRLIMDNPTIGKPFGAPPRRRHVVPHTPFVIYYQVQNDRLEIVRIWDARRNIEHLGFDKP